MTLYEDNSLRYVENKYLYNKDKTFTPTDNSEHNEVDLLKGKQAVYFASEILLCKVILH